MFYEILKKICGEKGTTVTTTLKELGISTASTGRWKTGSSPSFDTAIQISEHLGVSLNRLAYDTIDIPEKSSNLMDNEWEYIISHIPKEKQAMCKDFLRTHMVVPEKYADQKKG